MKLVLAVSPPASVAVSVIVVEPIWPVIGFRVMVRFAPDPPKEIPDVDSSVAFDDVAVTLSEPAEVSRSETVNDSGPTATPSAAD